MKNTTPITFEDFKERVLKKQHKIKNYYSLYITPAGEILDCRYPEDLGHNNFSVMVYENLETLPVRPFNSCLKGLQIPFNELPYYLEDYYKIFDLSYSDYELFLTIDKGLLGTEERICQDMGFIKVSINTNLKTHAISIPNVLFEKKVTAGQIEVIENISNLFNMDLHATLKQRQKDNMQIATKVKSVLGALST